MTTTAWPASLLIETLMMVCLAWLGSPSDPPQKSGSTTQVRRKVRGVCQKCKLQPGKMCSPSQGPRCTPQCDFKGSSDWCRPASECAAESFCNGLTALCPTSQPKENLTTCHADTQVCINGVCSGSICEKYNLEMCTCTSQDGKDEAAELCHVCCMEKNALRRIRESSRQQQHQRRGPQRHNVRTPEQHIMLGNRP